MSNYERLDPSGLQYYSQKLKEQIDKLKGTVLTGTLSVGSTSLVLSNSAIKTTSDYDIYTDKWGVCPKNVSVSNGSMTLIFDAQIVAIGIKVVVKEG